MTETAEATGGGCARFWSRLFSGVARPANAPQPPLRPATGAPTGSPIAAPVSVPVAAPAATPAAAPAKPPAPPAADPVTAAPQAEAAKAATSGAQETTGKCCPPPDWMPIALGELGVTEAAGAKINPRIAAYFKASKFWGTDDSGAKNAWCASLVAFVMKKAGYGIAKDAFRAREWAQRWPAGKKASRPVYGAIAVKTRTGGGHVGFVVGTVPGRPGYLAILGGNQSNTTNVSPYPATAFHSFMLPQDYDYSCCVLKDYTGKIAGQKGSES